MTTEDERWRRDAEGLFTEARALDQEAPSPAALARAKAKVRERLERGHPWRLPAAIAAAAAVVGLVTTVLVLKRPEAGTQVAILGGTLSREGDVLATGDGSAALAIGEAAHVTLDAHTRLRTLPGGELSLESGRATVVASGPTRLVARDVTLEVEHGGFAVACDGDRVEVHVTDGAVAVRRGGERVEVRAGETWPKAPALSQLEEAALLTQQGKLDAARALYQQIARGGAPAAELALYHLARLEAQHAQQNDAALAALDELLQRFPNGALAREARLSRIEALNALGRKAEAEEAARTLER